MITFGLQLWPEVLPIPTCIRKDTQFVYYAIVTDWTQRQLYTVPCNRLCQAHQS